MALSKGDIAAPFIQVKEDENGVLQDIKFVNDDNFNFAYDVVDKMAKKAPDKVAMLHISKDGKERSFTFYDMARYSSKVANYLQFLGIKKGDRVMLVLKRHYQFWFAILALHKIGAVAIPATNLLLKSDFEYRFKAGNVDAILCTADGPVSREVDKACRSYKNLKVKIMVGASRKGWRSFNKEVKYFSSHFRRPHGENAIHGDDPSIMFFTSGTTSYPKITTFCAPPTVYRVMVHLKLDQYDLSSLQNVTTAGEALNPEIFEKFKAKTGLTLMEGFGQTETTLTIGNLVGTTPKPGSMGVPTPQYDVQIMLPDGTLAGPEEEGEIVICTEDGAPNGLFMEYYGDEEKTQNAWHDGYYHTGDTAYFDEDGYLWYVGRTDDVIKSSGYRIGPFEIENEIMKLPYVLECAVTSVPDPIRGQAIKASIVLANGEEGTDKLRSEIMKSLKKNIASYKWPKILDFTKELPKTISGKIRRKEIKENDWNENEDNE